MEIHKYQYQYFQSKKHAIIEIVECDLGRVAQKWSNVSRICKY